MFLTIEIKKANPTHERFTASPYLLDEQPSGRSPDRAQSLTQIQSSANDVAIEQREHEINDIARGIMEVAEIFKDLQTLVIDQGTLLDRIDYNIETMHTHVQAADSELKQVHCSSNF